MSGTTWLWWRTDHSYGGWVAHLNYELDPVMAYRLGLSWSEFDGLANPHWVNIEPNPRAYGFRPNPPKDSWLTWDVPGPKAFGGVGT